MKKSLLALVIIVAAGLTQAASLGWRMTAIKTPADNTVAGEGYTALLFITEQSGDFGGTVTTLAAVTALADAGKYDDLEDLAVAQGTSTSAGGVSGATGYNGNNFGAGDSLKAFALIIDANKTHYFTTTEKSASWTSSTGTQNLAFGTQSGATYKSFGDVPEPATGALALAGVALLFRRRRA